MAGKKAPIKKVKLAKKSRAIIGKGVKHGSRFKGYHWLHPRVKRPQPRREPKSNKLATLNSGKRIVKHVNQQEFDVKILGKFPHEQWVQTLLHQIRCSTTQGARLHHCMIHHPKRKGKLLPDTYIEFLKFWYRRKGLERAQDVFDTMKRHGLENDRAYGLMAKCLATRGQLAKAKELMEEREANKALLGHDTLEIMVNYVAADNLDEGIQLFERLKRKDPSDRSVLTDREIRRKKQRHEPISDNPEFPSIEAYSNIIGWCLKHGDIATADKYLEERKQQYLAHKYDTPQNEEQSEKKAKEIADRSAERGAIIKAHRKQVAAAKRAGTFKKLVGQGLLKRPLVPPPLHPPKSWTSEEFLKQNPTTFTSHLIRPLMDLVEQGKPVPRAEEIGVGLRGRKAQKQIYGIAQILERGKSPRLKVLQDLLKILNLPAELGNVIHKKPVFGSMRGVVRPAPKDRTPVVKKWWKIPEKAPKVIPTKTKATKARKARASKKAKREKKEKAAKEAELAAATPAAPPATPPARKKPKKGPRRTKSMHGRPISRLEAPLKRTPAPIKAEA